MMPKCNPNLAGEKHVHNSPTHVKAQPVDSVRPGDRQMTIDRNGLILLVLPQSVRPGDVICDRMGSPLRRHRTFYGLRAQAF